MSQSISLYKQLANHKLFNKTINFDLKRIKLVLKKLGHPERKMNNVINFLGSSGKFTTLHSVKYFIEANKQTLINIQRDIEVSKDKLTDVATRLSAAEATWEMAENLYRQLADQVREHAYDIKDLNR